MESDIPFSYLVWPASSGRIGRFLTKTITFCDQKASGEMRGCFGF